MTRTPSRPSERTLSLRFSLGTAFALVVVVTSVLLGAATFRSARAFLREDIRGRLHDAAAMAAMMIDVEEHEAIRSASDEATDTYARLKSLLRAVRSSVEGVRFAYTMRREPDGRCVFVMDAEEDPGQVSHVGSEYCPVTPLMDQAFSSPGVRVEDEFGSDEWGTWLSSYAPLVDTSGRVVGILGLDISADRVVAHERRFLAVIALVTVVIGACGMIVGLLLARRLSAPLVVLEREMSKIQRFDLEGGAVIRTRIAEVSRMQDAVDNMKAGLRSFRKYVPADLVAELIRLGQEAVLGAEKRTVSVFFCDIAGFTTISETLSPEELASRMGAYFGGMTRIILEEGGTVDKYIGDSIMAFWGAPRPAADHAHRACRSAIRCRRFVEELSARWTSEGLAPFDTRFGLNTGEVNVGNFGYEERLSYTVMGDQVNLASRLEGSNKAYGTRILAAESTVRAAGSAIASRRIDVAAVKGRNVGVPIHEVLGMAGDLSAADRALVEAYERGLDLYQARKWDEAEAAFRRALEARAGDEPSRIMIGRCREYAANPPPPDWNGVHEITEK